MDPFENIIRELGNEIGITLKPDSHQACKIHFPDLKLSVQIDLDNSADKILVGTELGPLPAGQYREKILFQALRVNGLTRAPQGILAYSAKKSSLVLFQYFPLAYLSGKELFEFLTHFIEHATIWKEALQRGEIPSIEENVKEGGHRIFGLQK